MTLTPTQIAALGLPEGATAEEIAARIAELSTAERKNAKLMENFTANDGYPLGVPPHLSRAKVVARFKAMLECGQGRDVSAKLALSAEQGQFDRDEMNGVPYAVE